MKLFFKLIFLNIIFFMLAPHIYANILLNSSELALVSALDYANDLTGANPQASPYLAQSALGSYPTLQASIGRLAPYAPEYQYFNSDYYYPLDSD